MLKHAAEHRPGHRRKGGGGAGEKAAPDGAVIQRKCTQCEEAEEERLPVQRQEAPGPQPSPSATAPAIVDDGSPLAAGQMHRSTFMAQVRASVTGMCNAELAVVGRSADGCPYIQHYLDYYDQQPAASLMRAIQRYAGATPNADAPALMGALLGRVRSAVRTWVTNGDVTGVPAGVNPLDASAQPPAEAEAPPGGPALLAKREAGGGMSADPATVRSSLGTGHALDGGTRGRMENAFGQSFGDVRVHTGSSAAAWNSSLAARAFTVGTDVAFAPHEYRPGTLEGDLLIAHEMAHVAQQRGGGVPAAQSGDHGLEMEADRAAAAALGLLSSDEARILPGRGFALRRCESKKKEPAIRPGMGLGTELGPGEESKSWTLDEYIAAWEKKQGRKMTDEERKLLAKGCIGITGVNLGGMSDTGRPDSTECYDTFAHASARADELQKKHGSQPFIYSQRFWTGGESYDADSKTGQIDMSKYKNKAKPKPGGGTYVNFDYAWYDETTKTWWHASHCDPVTGSENCRKRYKDQRMEVYQSTEEHYSRPLKDFDKQVYCVAWSSLK